MISAMEFSMKVAIGLIAVLISIRGDFGPMVNPASESRSAKSAPRIVVSVSTDRKKYSLGDTLELDISLRNESNSPVYVGRKMELGLGGGLGLDIRDDKGNGVRSRMLLDSILPPPPADDLSAFVRLDEACFYGIWKRLPVRDFFPAPGQYSLQVSYKGLLQKDFVAPAWRDLPVIWSDREPSLSDPVTVEIVP